MPASEAAIGFTLFLKWLPSYFKTSENKSHTLPGDKLSHGNQAALIPKACSTDPTPPLKTNNNPQKQALTAQPRLAFNSRSSTSAFQAPRLQTCTTTWPLSAGLPPSLHYDGGHEGTLAISYIFHSWPFCSYKEIFLFFLSLKSNSHLLGVSLISVALMFLF